MDDKEVSGEGEGGGGGLGVTESSGGDGGDEANADDMTKTGDNDLDDADSEFLQKRVKTSVPAFCACLFCLVF